MMPSTVPSSPMRGDTEPMLARAGTHLASWSRSALASLLSNSRKASTCPALNTAGPVVVGPAPPLGRVAVRKWTARSVTRVNGDGGIRRASPDAPSSRSTAANSS